MLYINYYFKNIVYDDRSIVAEFSAPDQNVVCCFSYDRLTEMLTIWNNNKPVSEITPLPIHWLLRKLEQNGALNKNESKIS